MANKVYLVEISKTNATMDSLSSNMEKAKCYTVASADVALFEAELPVDTRYYMSSDEDDVQVMNGDQEEIHLPDRIIQN